MSGALTIHLRGESLILHPERALIWPRRSTVIVADTHFGKSSVFGQHGIAVPAGTDEEDRARLTRLVQEFTIRRLVVLGDFLHAPLESESEDARDMERWIGSFTDTAIMVVAGNHDRGISSGWRGRVQWIAGSHLEEPFRFVHDDSAKRSAPSDVFSLSGHIHPVVALRGLRKRLVRIPAFWLRRHGLVLPSFGLFTGGYLVEPGDGEQAFAVGPEQVTAFPRR